MGAVQNFQKKLIIKDDYVKKDGTSALYLYVFIDGNWDRIPLKLSWPPSHFDKESGKILPRQKGDKDHSDYQIMIDTELGKVNDIFKEYRLAKKPLTISKLLEEYNSFTSRKDFFGFFERDVNERYKRKKIEKGTLKGNLSSLSNLREFWEYEHVKKKGSLDAKFLPFNSLTPKLLENFRAWLKSHRSNVPSTVENHMKNVRTYVKRALADGNVFDDPFKVVKVTKPETYPDVLTQEQLHALLDLYQARDTPENWVQVLRHFLFSCFTGLRISDVKLVNHDNIRNDDWLVIMPKKTMGKQKTIRVPLHPMAKSFMTTVSGNLFDLFSDQYTNRLLTRIGEAAGVDFKIKTHTARHTFGTLFIELGGDVVTLKEYMGHRDLGTTMKYVHISERRKKEKINVFDKLMERQTPKK